MKKILMNKKALIVAMLVVLLAAAIVISSIVINNRSAKEEERQAELTFVKKAVITDGEVSNMKNYELSVKTDMEALDESYDISNLLYGAFLEDINFAVDAGLYAEMVKNRSFEYDRLATNGHKHGWGTTEDKEVSFEVIDGSKDDTGLNEDNTHYAVITNELQKRAGIYNVGYLDGLSIEKDKVYVITFYAKAVGNYSGNIEVSLGTRDGDIYGSVTTSDISNSWWKYEVKITANASVNSKVRLEIMINSGKVAVDMVSMFPTDTYNNRENGLRTDIVEYIAALEPKFLRFPGGCVVEGKSLETAYNWKDSIGNGKSFVINGETTVGDVAIRPQGIDLWADLNGESSNPYYVTYGCGFYEYFVLCEDIGCLPIPILNAGMSCPIQSPNYTSLDVNSSELQQYIQDALDLVEFCRGDASTKWGAIRIAMGHKEPFELRYIGIGNEQWQNEYFTHYKLFLDAFKQAAIDKPDMYGDIELIVANGPAATDRFGWNKVETNGKTEYAGLVDEHYYMTPSWFLDNVDRYNSYDRTSVPVFLGEYAAKSNTLDAALAEAAFMTGLEKNADIVKMACYAPLLANTTSNQWTPDLIWYANNMVYGSINYYVQKIFSTNVGVKMLKAGLTEKNVNDKLTGMVGIGTWKTEANFDNIKIVNNDTDEVIFKENFDKVDEKDFFMQTGKFSVANGILSQTNKNNPVNENIGDVIYFANVNCKNYTYTIDATKISGTEGFLVPIAVKDTENCIFWNIGGWDNTISCLQMVQNGSKSDQIDGTVMDLSINVNTEYKLKVVVNGNRIRCYMGRTLVVDYEYNQNESVYESCSIDDNEDIIIKLVNVSGEIANASIDIDNIDNYNKLAMVQTLSGEKSSYINTESVPKLVTIVDSTYTVANSFTYQLPKYSVTVIRIKKE